MLFNKIISNYITEVRNVIKDSEDILKVFPEGRLRVRHRGNWIQYFNCSKNETTGKYLGKNDVEQIKDLEEKLYYTRLLSVAKREEQKLVHIQKELEEIEDYQSVFLTLPREKRHLIAPYERKPKWKDREIIQELRKKPVAEDVKLFTQNGERVRSKSELIIADRLQAAKVPYYYEDPLFVNSYWHPDFRVQNVKTRKEFYWEHFGMLDNPEYCKSCLGKLEIYALYGYFPGENLIITAESSNHGLNTEYVDCLIEKFLKPL